MASRARWTCLARPSHSVNAACTSIPRAAFLPTSSSPFSTSIPRQVKLKKRKRPEKVGKPPAPGERKALRKMIVLSNTNALAVPGLQEMSAENVSDPQCRGTVVAIPDKIVSQLRAADAFQTKQKWKLFRKPSIVMRSLDVRLAQMMDDVGTSTKTIKQIMVGERGSGKSLYLLQAMASAMLKGWTVLTIPEGQDLINATTDYSPIPNVRPTMYSQKAYTAGFLQRIINANPQLADMKLQLKHQLQIEIPPDFTLAKLATLGINDAGLSLPIFEAFMQELIAPGRPPILITLDGLNHINKMSDYRSATYQLIHAHDFFIPAWFLSHLSGKSQLPNGGAVLAAMTRSNGPHIEALDDRLAQLEKQQAIRNGNLELKEEDNINLPFLKAIGQADLATQVPDLDPFVRYDTRVLSVFNHNSPAQSRTDGGANAPTSAAGLITTSKMEPQSHASSWAAVTPADCDIEVKRFHGLTKMEAKALMEYWALSGIVRAEINERFVGEQWSVSGGGLPGELERTCLAMRYT